MWTPFSFLHCDDKFLAACLFCLFAIAFCMRVDSVSSRNGMNKVLCILYSVKLVCF